MSNGRNERPEHYPGYKPVPTETIRAMAEERGGRYDSIFKGGIIPWKPHAGSNLIRFLPPTWDGFSHYAYRIWAHQWVGPELGSYICPRMHSENRKPCPICREAKRAQEAGDEDEKKKLEWQERYIAWILDRDGDDPTRPILFNMSFTQNRDIQAIRFERRSGDALAIDHPDLGYDLSFERTGAGLKSRYSAYRLDRNASAISDSKGTYREILDYVWHHPIPEMLLFQPPDYLERALIGGGDPPPDQRGHELLHATSSRYEDDDDASKEWATEEIDTTPQPEPRRQQREPRETMGKQPREAMGRRPFEG